MKTYPLTETMLGMFLQWNQSRESTQYTIAVASVFPKAINAARLVEAVEESVAAHDVFRMKFVQEDEEVRWTIDDAISIKVARSEMSDAEADAFCRTTKIC